MFELYFGAFDLVLYGLGFIAAVMISGGICDVLDSEATALPSASIHPVQSYVSCERSVQSIARLSVSPSPVQASSAETTSRLATAQRKPVVRMSDIRLYKLHQHSVVFLSALPFSIPECIKRYMLRGEPVVRLESLQEIATVIA
ncbi:MAG: hypothetical protein AAFZ17_04435 [Cyanobacteria bacterium J06650_10]